MADIKETPNRDYVKPKNLYTTPKKINLEDPSFPQIGHERREASVSSPSIPPRRINPNPQGILTIKDKLYFFAPKGSNTTKKPLKKLPELYNLSGKPIKKPIPKPPKLPRKPATPYEQIEILERHKRGLPPLKLNSGTRTQKPLKKPLEAQNLKGNSVKRNPLRRSSSKPGRDWNSLLKLGVDYRMKSAYGEK